MALNPVKYTECPYCAFKYTGDSKPIKLAMAGHINKKHPDKAPVDTGKDFNIIIPTKADTAATTATTTNQFQSVSTDSSNTDLGPNPNSLSPLDVEAEVEEPTQEQKAELERKKQELEQKLKELQQKMNK